MMIQSNLLRLVMTGIVLISSGCASITGTTHQSVSVQTRLQEGKEVSGSACELTNNKGKWFVTSPGSVTVTRSNDDMQVICKKEGLEPGRASVVSETKGSMFGNIIFGGGIGAVIDHNSGAAYEYPALIQVLMGAFTKIEAPGTSGEPSQQEQPKAQPVVVQQSAALPPQASAPAIVVSSTREEKLKEIKRLSDAGLISQEVYLEQQRKILETPELTASVVPKQSVRIADVPLPEKPQNPDLMTAVMNSNKGDVNYFISRGADINQREGGTTYLIAAVIQGNLEMTRFLVGKGADVNQMDSRGLTPMTYAKSTRQSNPELIRLLEESGATNPFAARQ